MNKVKLQLVGLNGNAFSLIAAFKQAAREQKFDKEFIDGVVEKCMSGDYNNLLVTLMEHTEAPDDEGEEWDEDYYDYEDSY